MNKNRKGKYTIDESYFDVIDTEDKAYFLGLLYADGCNYEDGTVKIDLIESDKDILLALKEKIKSTRPLSYYKAETKIINGEPYNCQPTCRFIINNKHVSNVLSNYGIVFHKSQYCEYIKDGIVPDNLFHHWVRGIIDGNGGLSNWIDNEFTGHRKFKLYFCGTIDVVTKIAELLQNKFNCTPTITDRYPDRDNNNLQFEICGNQLIRKACDWLYKDAHYYLKRKYNEYELLIQENTRTANNKTLYGSMRPRRSVIHLTTGIIYESLAEAERSTGINRSNICVQAKKGNGKWAYIDNSIYN